MSTAEVWNSLDEHSKTILRETMNDTLRIKANQAVLACGRGRLRGKNPEDYEEIGTNRSKSVVSNILDGEIPRPDTSRFEKEVWSTRL